jgi:hypothetical protein
MNEHCSVGAEFLAGQCIIAKALESRFHCHGAKTIAHRLGLIIHNLGCQDPTDCRQVGRRYGPTPWKAAEYSVLTMWPCRSICISNMCPTDDILCHAASGRRGNSLLESQTTANVRSPTTVLSRRLQCTRFPLRYATRRCSR